MGSLIQVTKVTVKIPFDCEMRWIHINDRLRFVYIINGKAMMPSLKDIRKFQAIYDCKSFKAISGYLEGETLEMTIMSI